MSEWYEVRAAADAADEVDVWLYGDIGENWWGDEEISTSARVFCREFAAIKAQRINLRVNSLGGSVKDGQAIHNAIARHPAQVTAYIDAWACSVSSVIPLAADRVIIAANGMMMIHNALWAGCGYFFAADMRTFADWLDKLTETIVGVYVAKTGRSSEEISAAMDAETWFTAQEAVDFGLADEIGIELEAAAHVSGDPLAYGYRHLPERLASAAARQEPSQSQSAPAGSASPLEGGSPSIETAETFVSGLGFARF